MKYYKDNRFFRFLRFFNLLEPENNILSISKIFMWAMLGILFYVLFMMPNHLDLMLTSIGGVLAATMNYSYRRWIRYRRETTDKSYEDSDRDRYFPYMGSGMDMGSGRSRNIDDYPTVDDVPETPKNIEVDSPDK